MMFNSIFGNLASGHHTVGAVQPPGATAVGSGQSLNMSQLQGLANQQFNNAYAAQMHAQQQAAYNQALGNLFAQQQPKHWMIAGKAMHFEEFLDTLCPEEDDPMRTFLTLKYKGIK